MAAINQLEREHSNYENELGGALVIETSFTAYGEKAISTAKQSWWRKRLTDRHP